MIFEPSNVSSLEPEIFLIVNQTIIKKVKKNVFYYE